MITSIYRLADKTVQIESHYDTVHCLCRDYASDEKPDFSVTITPEDIRKEQEKSILQDTREGKLPRQLPEDYLETLAVYRRIAEKMVEYDTLLFHGSAIALDGEGYLFTAKSGTGKSTHTRLWREVFGNRAVMVNDDKPLLKITASGVLVCGTPWDGKHHLSSNIQAPLKAICILQRGETNQIREITPSEALPQLLQQCYHPEIAGGLLKQLALLDLLSHNVKFFLLQCNMDREAALTAHAAMAT